MAATPPLPRRSSGREDGPEGTVPRRRRPSTQDVSVSQAQFSSYSHQTQAPTPLAWHLPLHPAHTLPPRTADRKTARLSGSHPAVTPQGRRIPHGAIQTSPRLAPARQCQALSHQPHRRHSPVTSAAFLGHWRYAPRMEHTSSADSSRSCLPKISGSFSRDRELFFTALLTWQLFLN